MRQQLVDDVMDTGGAIAGFAGKQMGIQGDVYHARDDTPALQGLQYGLLFLILAACITI